MQWHTTTNSASLVKKVGRTEVAIFRQTAANFRHGMGAQNFNFTPNCSALKLFGQNFSIKNKIFQQPKG